MGGAEINLSQADFEGKVILEITQVFGGTALIIPANWEVQSESTAILGGIEDKRAVNDMISNGSKILVLKGVTVFGGIEIKNY
jgi:predicted membrane protein